MALSLTRGLQAAPAAAIRSRAGSASLTPLLPACPKPGDIVVLSPSYAQQKITTLTSFKGTAQWHSAHWWATLYTFSPELSHRPKQKLCPHPTLAPSPPPASCLCLAPLGTSHEQKHTGSVSLCLAYLSEHNVLKLHLCCSGYQDLLPLAGQMIFRHVSRSCFADPSSVVDICGASYVLAAMNDA